MKTIRPKILVVDDEAEVLSSLNDLLRIDFDVLTFTRAADALAELAHTDVPVVMSDQYMPEMKGVEFLTRVKDLRPDCTRLLFTGYSDIKAVIDAINRGSIYRYITKPWEPEELTSILRQAVRVHDLIVENRRLVTELKQTNAELLEANLIKSKFIEVASHELNTPVAIVVGLTELWKLTQADEKDPTQRNWVERIEGAGKRLANIVSRMLKLLQVSQFDRTLEVRPTEIEPLVRGVIEHMRPFLSVRRQEVDFQCDPDAGTAELDAAKIDDALTNLLFNAIKFTPDGQTIRVVVAPEGPDAIRFQVIDPGMGINAQERRHLFELFFTSYDTMKHSSGEFQYGKRGIGLGLHLVKTFVEMHHGTVDVTSAPNCGSTFSFILPRFQPAIATRALAV